MQALLEFLMTDTWSKCAMINLNTWIWWGIIEASLRMLHYLEFTGGKNFISISNSVFEETPSISEVPLPFGWKMERVSEERFKVTPIEDYLELAEEAERMGKRYVKAAEDKYDIVYENSNFQEESISCATAKNKFADEWENSNPFQNDEKSEYLSLSENSERKVNRIIVIMDK